MLLKMRNRIKTELKRTTEERDVLKKLAAYFAKVPEKNAHSWISIAVHLRLSNMCRVLKVHRSGYYAWKACPKSERALADEALLIDIKQSF